MATSTAAPYLHTFTMHMAASSNVLNELSAVNFMIALQSLKV